MPRGLEFRSRRTFPRRSRYPSPECNRGCTAGPGSAAVSWSWSGQAKGARACPDDCIYASPDARRAPSARDSCRGPRELAHARFRAIGGRRRGCSGVVRTGVAEPQRSARGLRGHCLAGARHDGCLLPYADQLPWHPGRRDHEDQGGRLAQRITFRPVGRLFARRRSQLRAGQPVLPRRARHRPCRAA